MTKVKNIEQIFKKYHKLEEITLEDKNGNEFKRERLHRENAVACLVFNKNTKKFIFCKQWRPGPLDDAIEIPAGLIDKGELKEEAMKREILEEIGYEVDDIKEIVPEYFASIGYTNEKITIFYAEVSKKIAIGGGTDSGENIEIIELTYNEATEQVHDGKSILALTKLYLLDPLKISTLPN